LTLTDPTVPTKPDTFSVLVFTVLSAIGTAIVPDETVVGKALWDEVMLNAALPPGHIAAEVGEIVGAGGDTLTDNVAGFDISGKPPPEQVITARY
jgi:hypothetical protein